jgi:hypothetical protein
VRVEEQRQRRAEGKRRVAERGRIAEHDPVVGHVGRAGELLLGGAEDGVEAAELDRDRDDRDDHHDVDQRVLDERDQGRSSQARLVRVGREHREREDDRQVTRQPDRLDHRLDAHELQGDVGHRRDDAGERDRERERRRPMARANEVGRRGHPVPVGDRPDADGGEQNQRVDDDRVGNREEADRAEAEDERRNRDEGVGGVDVAAEQEPRDPAAELAPAETPLVDILERSRAAPAHRGEPDERNEEEQRQDDRKLEPVDRGDRHHSPRVLT